MVHRKQGGSIVQISSIASTKAFPRSLIYAASKAAVDQMMKVMALEWGPHQVRISYIYTYIYIYIYRNGNQQ